MGGLIQRRKVQQQAIGDSDMVRVIVTLCFCLPCVNSFALNCEGTFEQKVVVEDEEWSWSYSNRGYSLSGETLLHKERESFSVIASEDEECRASEQCSTTNIACAVTFALIEPLGRAVPIGRVQVTSYGLYSSAREKFLETKDCDQAYREYYSKIQEYWKNNLSVFDDRYLVKKVQAREIKLNKPKELGDQCFDRSLNLPPLWSGADFFPVLTIEQKEELGSE